ncbi:Phosducin-like protein 2 [Yarrowia sp. C11]|nr:Phosducin-like protein 2 [Yarrowia sp. E02]KAG5369546.1 Phosducin-like protein 2 [Yarrowia sp. C11]
MMNVQVNEAEDTEWNDILRQHGVIPERPPSPTSQIEAALEEAIQKQHDNRLEGLELDELDALEDDEDEAFLEQYRLKRIAEIKQLASREQYGSVVKISKPEYVEEITEASKKDPRNPHLKRETQKQPVEHADARNEIVASGDPLDQDETEGTYVFVHISHGGVPESRLLSGLFDRAAQKFPDVKFVDIDSKQINEKYSLASVPTILVYYKGNPINQVVALEGIGGKSTNMEDIEAFLVKMGAVQANDKRLIVNQDKDEDELQRQTKTIYAGSRDQRDESDYDSDFD